MRPRTLKRQKHKLPLRITFNSPIDSTDNLVMEMSTDGGDTWHEAEIQPGPKLRMRNLPKETVVWPVTPKTKS